MASRKKENVLQGVTDKTSAEQALQEASYEKSQAVLDAQNQLEQHMAHKPGEYTSGYQQQIDGMLDQILNREGFTYDFSTDPMYQSYKNQYVHEGRLAMQNSMAEAAALTGGYGSSYGVAAGSQAYQGYLNQLNDKIPVLYQAALDRYDSEGKQMHDALDDLLGAEKAAHTAYQAEVDNYYKGLSQYRDLADSAYKKDYQEYQDMIDSLTDMRDYYAAQDEQAFKRKQDELAHELAVKKFEESVRQWQAEQAAAAAKQAEAVRQWEAEQAAAEAKWRAQLAQSRAELAYKRGQANKKEKTASGHSSKITKREMVQMITAADDKKKPAPSKKAQAQIRTEAMRDVMNRYMMK